MSKKKYPLEFPEGEHQNCQTLTGLSLEHLPRDGSLGRVRRYQSGADVWQPDDRQDRLYFLQSGHVAVVVSDMEGREVVLRAIEVGEPFGELCFCGRYKLRATFARAVDHSGWRGSITAAVKTSPARCQASRCRSWSSRARPIRL